MNKTEKKEYRAPQLKVVSFKIEQGFAGSPYQQIEVPDQNIESHTVRTGWRDNANNEYNNFF